MARKALWRFASNFGVGLGVGLGRARRLFCLSIAHVAVVAVLSADSISYNFLVFDIPGNNDTRATGINNAGEVVGSSADAGIVRGFLRSADGSFTFFTVPGIPDTLARDINDLKQIVGSFFDPRGPHAFLRDTDGMFRMLDAPGYLGTSANSINNLGQIAGFVEDSFGVQHGFLLSKSGYTYFDVPAPGGTLGTAAWGINNAGEIVGSYISAIDERDHGFIRNAAGDSYLLFDFPGSIITDAYGINDSGQVVGSYVLSGAQHGFVRCPDGTYLSLDAPGSDGGFNQNFFGINNDGQLSGLYLGLNGNLVGYHGFIATPDAKTAGKCKSPKYQVCLLYDPIKAVNSGATIPVKLQLCDASANDLSSSSIIAHATSVTQVSTSISVPVEDSGNANPDNDFRFDATLGATGGYIFNLKTTRLTTGTYNLNFIVTGDTATYAAPFQVK